MPVQFDFLRNWDIKIRFFWWWIWLKGMVCQCGVKWHTIWMINLFL